MESGRALLVFGTLLLATSAVLGFVQERHRDSPEAFVRWRVVHAGGTAGGVQLIALSTIWQRLPGTGTWIVALAWGLIFAAWAFFLGPTARALGQPRCARALNIVGAVVALPSYLALPAILLL
jgi:uncharacterized BrkB/YihY/UPF0761 family membrane protein